jgi:hypothetical protein
MLSLTLIVISNSHEETILATMLLKGYSQYQMNQDPLKLFVRI